MGPPGLVRRGWPRGSDPAGLGEAATAHAFASSPRRGEAPRPGDGSLLNSNAASPDFYVEWGGRAAAAR